MEFKFQVGDIVIQNNEALGVKEIPGIIQWRRNAYPEPMFTGFWFPIYMVENLKPAEFEGQEIHERCLRLASTEEQNILLEVLAVNDL